MQGVHTRIDQYTDDGVYVQTWKNASEAAKMLGFASTNITRALDHPTSRVAGYMWKSSYSDFEPGPDRYTMRYVPTDAQYYEFNRRILKYVPVFYNLVKKFPFISPLNVDDYLQEAIIYAWRRYDSFKHFEGDGAAFGGWCKAIFTYSILSYSRVLTSKLRFKLQADELIKADEEVDDSAAYILAIYHFMDDMPESDRKILMAYVECDNEQEMFEKTGLCKATFRRHLKQICYILKHRIKYYVDGILESKEVIEPIGKWTKGRPIEQFDMDGNFIARYSRGADVRAKGFDPSQVSAVIHKTRGSYKGFLWRFAKDQRNVEIGDRKCA